MSEKTEKPTDKKLEDSRKKGDIPKGQKLPVVGGLIGGFLGCITAMQYSTPFISNAFIVILEAKVPEQLKYSEVLQIVVLAFLAGSMPVAICSILGTVIATMAQTKGLVTFASLQPKPEKLLGLDYFKRYGSPQPVYDALLMLVFATVFIALGVSIFQGAFVQWAHAYGVTPKVAQTSIFELFRKVMLNAIGLGIVIAIADYVYQYVQFMKKQKMSKDDIKKEYKEQEGDPMIKGMRRQIAREISNSPMQKRTIQGASMVVTNPTHVAVVLVRDKERRVPVVVLTGVDDKAQEIKRKARHFGVPIFEDVPLARLLLATTPVGQPIPKETYKKVAALLAKIEAAQQKKKGTFKQGFGSRSQGAQSASSPQSADTNSMSHGLLHKGKKYVTRFFKSKKRI
jgi:flagellar biosynthesis protein FlhB